MPNAYSRAAKAHTHDNEGIRLQKLLAQAGFKDIHVKKDLAGLDRVVYAVKAAEDGGK